MLKLMRTAVAAGIFALASVPAMAEFDKFYMTVISGPGSGQDQFVRAVAQILRDEWLASGIEIENVIGGNGTAAIARVIQSGAGDGNRVLGVGATSIIFPLTNKVDFDLSDLTPIVRLLGDYQCLVVAADSDIKTLDDLIAKIKADPGSVPNGGSVAGSNDNIFFAQFVGLIGGDVKRVNHIPHPNSGEVAVSLLSHQVVVATGTPQDFAGQVEAGKVRILAVAAPERVEGVDAPTFKELGVDLVSPLSRGFYANKDITPEQKAALEDMFAKMAKSEAWKKLLAERHWADQYQTSADYGAFVEDATVKAKNVLKTLGFIKE